MFKEYLSVLCGNVKMVFYKLFYFRRIKTSFPQRFSYDFCIYIKKKSFISIGSNIRTRSKFIIRCDVGARISIGDNCFFNNYNSINAIDEISIGNNCLFGENVKIYDHNHRFNENILIRNQGFTHKPVLIGNNVWIGSNTVILKGVTIGDNVVIGANCTIRDDIPSNSIVSNRNNLSIEPIAYKRK